MATALDLGGKKFSKLKVVERVENNRYGQTQFKCICDCGEEFVTVGSRLVRGHTKSCGCTRNEKIANLNKTHGHTVGYGSSKTRNSWRGMKERCDNPKNSHYPSYGGRGISYPDKWKTLEGFLEDMGERPEGLSLERIDVNKDYAKDNCKWDTPGNQAFNITLKSNNTSGRSGVKLSANGEKWIAFIGHNGEHNYLGTYDTFEEAVAVREKAEIDLYGFSKQ